jgi:hypothetical protein
MCCHSFLWDRAHLARLMSALEARGPEDHDKLESNTGVRLVNYGGSDDGHDEQDEA